MHFQIRKRLSEKHKLVLYSNRFNACLISQKLRDKVPTKLIMFKNTMRSYSYIFFTLFGIALLLPYTVVAGTQAKAKVAILYTVTTPQLKSDVERALRDELSSNIELITCEEASIFKEIVAEGYVGQKPAAKYAAIYLEQVKSGADVVLSVCSSVADIAYAMRDISAFMGVPLIDINEEMCREAVRKGCKITVVATFPSAIGPIGRTLERKSREMGKHIEVRSVLVDGGFGLDKETFKSLMAKELKKPAESSDVIIFAQSSMAYCANYIKELYGKEVLSNPKFGAKAVRAALLNKGFIK